MFESSRDRHQEALVMQQLLAFYTLCFFPLKITENLIWVHFWVRFRGLTLRFKQPAAGGDAMDRIANHKTNSVTDVYNRHGYEAEDKRIVAAVARHVIGLVEAEQTSNVVVLK
jgi:hypothetical protein